MRTKRSQRKRSAASKLVIALREALGKTQFEFAAFVAKTSLITITRWEHSRPPTGEALLRLAAIAFENGQEGLGDKFERLFLDEIAPRLHAHKIELIYSDGSSYEIRISKGEK